MKEEKRRLLISMCLLNVPCRYDGQHRGLPPDTLRALARRWELIPVCPEQLGGLPTPRLPAERRGARGLLCDGRDVTEEYRRGAEAARDLARLLGADAALLKERSPSCGSGRVYDGSYTGTLIPGDGVAAGALKDAGVTVYGESELALLL